MTDETFKKTTGRARVKFNIGIENLSFIEIPCIVSFKSRGPVSFYGLGLHLKGKD